MKAMKFPEMPSLHGHWHPVIVTPISHSLEQVTVAVVAIDAEGCFLIKEAISDAQYEQVFTNSGMRNIVNFCLQSLHNWMEAGKPVSEWRAPLTGTELGEGRDAADDNLDGIAIQGLRMSSFFYSLSHTKLVDEGVTHENA